MGAEPPETPRFAAMRPPEKSVAALGLMPAKPGRQSP